MIYGKVENELVKYYGRTDISGNWNGVLEYRQSLVIDSNNKAVMQNIVRTAAEMIDKYSLQQIVVPNNFDGVCAHYNYTVVDNKIVLSEYTNTYNQEKYKLDLINELKTLEASLDKSSAALQNYVLETECGFEHHHDLAYITALKITHLEQCRRCTEIKTILSTLN